MVTCNNWPDSPLESIIHTKHLWAPWFTWAFAPNEANEVTSCWCVGDFDWFSLPTSGRVQACGYWLTRKSLTLFSIPGLEEFDLLPLEVLFILVWLTACWICNADASKCPAGWCWWGLTLVSPLTNACLITNASAPTAGLGPDTRICSLTRWFFLGTFSAALMPTEWPSNRPGPVFGTWLWQYTCKTEERRVLFW